MNRPLGCLTTGGLLAGVLTAVATAAAALLTGNSIFSPGELSAATGLVLDGVSSHAELQARCSACHPAFWDQDRMDDRCIRCHSEITEEMLDPSRLHGVLPAPVRCRACHTEHEGPQADLTPVLLLEFPHERVGFSLRAHAPLLDADPGACVDCHSGSLRDFGVRACAECHFREDPAFSGVHMVDFGPECLSCHDGIDRYGAEFDHDARSFPLSGAHAEVSCRSCHAPATSIPELRAAPTECFECHLEQDPHGGRLGTACGECHRPTTWQEATIDHSITSFPLRDRHAEVECLACHMGRQWAGIPVTCVGCHAAEDAHQGRFGTDCAACHRPTAWQDATFDHDRSAFPLTGAHRNLSCTACHSGGSFAGTPSTCAGCHPEPGYHAGVLGLNCAGCHSTSSWLPASYGGPHTFPMDHEGAGGSCATCHPSSLGAYTCSACHDPGHMADKHKEMGDYSNCIACHPTGDKEEGGDD